MSVEIVFLKIKNAIEAGTRNWTYFFIEPHLRDAGRVLEELQMIAVKNRNYDANSDAQCIGT